MPQIGLALIAVASVAWLSLLVWQTGAANRPRPIVLAVLPIGLLFLTIPPVAAAIGMISGFRLAAEGTRGVGVGAIAPFLSDYSWCLLWGGLGLLVTMLVAAVLQAWSLVDSEEATPADVPEPPTFARAMILAIVSLFIIPVAYYTYVDGRLPGVVMDAAAKARNGVPVGAGEISETSRTIASALVRTVIGGAALSLLLAGCAVAGLIAVKRGKLPQWLFTYSWVALVAAAALAAWSILHGSADLRALERLI